MTRCFFTTLGYEDCVFRADGMPDRAHLISRQRLKRNGYAEHVWDSRTYILACRRHHHLHDNGFIRLTRAQLPQGVIDFADQHGLEWSLDRDFGAVA